MIVRDTRPHVSRSPADVDICRAQGAPQLVVDPANEMRGFGIVAIRRKIYF